MSNTENRTNSKAVVPFDVSALPHIASILTPVFLLITSLLYITGYSVRAGLLDRFGLNNAFAEPSLQSTLANGFPLILFASLLLGLITSILWFIVVVIKHSINRSNTSKNRTIAQKFINDIRRINKVQEKVVGFLMIASIGFVAGRASGENHAVEIKSRVDGGCKTGCFLVSSSIKRYRGAIIAQDQQRVAIYTKLGTFLIEAKDVQLIQPVNFDETSLKHDIWKSLFTSYPRRS